MADASPALNNFTGGEFSPRLRGRFDFAKYHHACATLQNMIVHPHGGATRRPGTYFVTEVKDSTKFVRLIPFEFSTEQAYIIEMGDQYMRFYKDHGQIVADTGIELITNGEFENSIVGWENKSESGASIAHDDTNDDMDITGDGTHYGWAEQNILIVSPSVEHVLKFEVKTGAVYLRVGSTSGDDDLYSETSYAVGTHAVLIDPDGNDTIYLQFRHNTAATHSIDDVSLKKIVVVADGGFEEWSSATDLHLWSETETGSSTVNREATVKHAGDYSLKIDIDASDNGAYVLQSIVLTQGVKYNLSVWYKNSLSGKTSLIQIRDSSNTVGLKSDGTWGDDSEFIELPNSTEWTEFVLEFEAHSSYSNYKIRIGHIILKSSATSSSIYFDDLEITHPCEIETPYTEDELLDVGYAQSADTLFLAHSDHKPRQLMRFGHYDWKLMEIDFIDGPYDEVILSGITPSAVSGEITLTASESMFGKPKWYYEPGAVWTRLIREPYYFNEEYDVGRHFRVWGESPPQWYWLKITEIISPIQVKALVMGVEGTTQGDLPGLSEFPKLQFGCWSDGDGYPSAVSFYEQRLWWAKSKNYPQGIWSSKSAEYSNMQQGTDDDLGMTYIIHSQQVNSVNWLSSGNVMFVGTHGGVFLIRSSGVNNPITPTNVQIKRQMEEGCCGIPPIMAGLSTLFVHRARRKLMELAYSFEADGYRANDLTILAEHITQGGIAALTYQAEPDSIVWGIRADGVLIGMTFKPQHNVIAWHKHPTQGEFESHATIPTETENEVWFSVKRNIDGTDKRYIEYMKPVDWGDDQEDCYFVDCGLTYDGPPATKIWGFDHLAGEEAAILADGATHPKKTVAADGSITLEREASVVHGGLSYESVLETMPIDPAKGSGVSQGYLKRISELVILFYKTLGCQYGRDADNLSRLPFGPSEMDSPPPLFTGLKEMPFSANEDYEGVVYLKQDQPLPMTILGIYPKMRVSDA